MEIARGAEAVIIRENKEIVKNRVRKGYRIREIDGKLRKERTRKEAKLLSDAKRAGVTTPAVLEVTENTIRMEYVKGKLLRDNIDSLKNWKEVCGKIGENLAKLHGNNLIHGDLTTSNMILRDYDVYFIDFGLGFESKRVEDKAVDLRVLEESLQAKHYENYKKYFETIIKTYNNPEVIRRLCKIRKRIRYA